MFLGTLDPGTGRLRYVNAGHNAPLLFADGSPATLDATGVPIGIVPDFPYAAGEVTLGPGTLLAVFTDGIPEAKRGKEFFDDRRLVEVLSQRAGDAELEAVADAVVTSVDEFLAGEPRTDDVTLVLVRRDGVVRAQG